jgi:ATP synthase protein I
MNRNDKFSSFRSKELRKLKQIKKRNKGVWFGLGFIGVIGWSIVIPTAIGIFLGLWLDKNFHQEFSWTLSLLILGVVGGCVLAWHWIKKENKEIKEEQKNIDE